MPQRGRFSQQRHRARPGTAHEPVRLAPPPTEKRPPVQYGKPFILLEDENKSTYEFKAGKWVEHGMTIAQCRVECQVKVLPQKLKNMTRYEIRSPI